MNLIRSIDWHQEIVDTGSMTDEDGKRWVTNEPTGKGRMTVNGIRVPFKLGTKYLVWRSHRW